MKSLTPQERENLLLFCLQKVIDGEMTEGQVLRKLRKEVLDMNQDEYAALVKVSRRTLSDIENDTGSQSIAVINSVFKPFGLRLGLYPTNRYLFGQMLIGEKSEAAGLQKVKSFSR
jgi:DNA-binding XRE family transcriptional regulator